MLDSDDTNDFPVYKEEEVLEKKEVKEKHYFRYWICIICTGLLTMMQSNVLAFNFTVLCMQEEDEKQFNMTSSANLTMAPGKFTYSKLQQDLLIAAAYIAPVPSTIIMYLWSNRSGVRTTFIICAIISIVSTGLSPWAAYQGFPAFLAVRFFQGFPVAIVPVINSVVTSHWSTLAGNGVYLSIISAYYQLAPLLTMPLSAVMCGASGWQSVYYFQTALTILFTVLLAFFYTDKPADNRFVHKEELEEIDAGKSHEEKHMEKAKTPMWEVHTDSAIWAIWLTSIGGTIGFNIFLQYGPTYLNKVLHYTLSTTGWSAAIPYIFSAVARIAAQPLTANCTFLGERLAAIISTTISQGIMSICFLVLMLIPQDWSYVGQLCYSLVIVANGLNGVGITRSAQLVCKQHLSFVLTTRLFYIFSVGLLLPILVNAVAPDNTHAQWNILFLIIFVIVLSSNVFFIIFARATPASWTLGTSQIDDRTEHEIEEMRMREKKF